MQPQGKNGASPDGDRAAAASQPSQHAGANPAHADAAHAIGKPLPRIAGTGAARRPHRPPPRRGQGITAPPLITAPRIEARPRITTDFLVRRRRSELGLAAAALSGLAACKGPVTDGQQQVVMAHLDTLFGWTAIESQQARDRLFEATIDHGIADWDRPCIRACAAELTRIAAGYRGHDGQAREIWAAGFALFEIDSLWDAAQPACVRQREAM